MQSQYSLGTGTTNGWADLGNPVSLQLNDPFSIDFWCCLTGTGGAYAAMIGHGAGGWVIGDSGEAGNVDKIFVAQSGGAPFMNSTTVLAVGVWHHVVYVRNGTNHKLYVDSVKEAEVTWAGTFTFANGAGIGHDPGGSYFNGNIDEMHIWDIALTPTQVDYLYDKGAGRYIPSNPVYCLGFAGTHQKAYSTDVFNVTWNAPYSWDFWIYPKVLPVTYCNILWKGASQQILFTHTFGGYSLWLQFYTPGTGILGVYDNTQIVANAWQHIVITYDGSGDASGVNFYTNGVKSVSKTIVNDNLTGSVSNTDNFSIGNNDDTNWAFNGYIDEFRGWGRELMQTDANDLYNSGEGKYKPANITDLIYDFHFDEGIGTSTIDSVSNTVALILYASYKPTWEPGKVSTSLPGMVSGWHFDEGTGGYVYDFVGSNNGTLGGSITWVVPRVNNHYRDVNTPMTSNSTPSPIVITRDSVIDPADEAWMVFAKIQCASDNSEAPGDIWHTAIGLPHWVKIDLGAGNEKAIVAFRFLTRWRDVNNRWVPTNFNLQGSTNDSSWTTLKSVSGYVDPGSKFWTQWWDFVNTTPYRYYLFTVTACNEGGYTSLDEFQMSEKADRTDMFQMFLPGGLNFN